jgi:outer membrane protein assembly factor BamB
VAGGAVFSPTRAGSVFCHDAATGELRWQTAATSAPLAGTPAHDGTLIYLPGDDGLHLVSAAQGRAVRRYGLARPVRSAPVVAGGTLFFGATDGRVYGVEANRSQLQTLYETGASARGGLGTQIVAPLTWENNILFVAATNGVLYALGAAATATALPPS